MNHQYHRTGPASRLRHWALAALLATGAIGSAQAQFYSATGVTNTAGTYTDLGTAGTAIATANTDDANSAATPIGFTFTYNGTAYTQFVLNTNGYLKLGTTAPSAPYFNDGGLSTTGGPTSGTDTDLVMPFNGDLTAGTAGNTEYRVSTTGTAPNRVCTIQWKNISDKARPVTASSAAIDVQYANFSFQTKLYEAAGQIDFVYGTATAGPAAGDNPKIINVGVKGSTTTAMVLGVKSSVTAWSQTVFINGAYTGNGHNVRQSVLPDAGRTYRFLPLQANDASVTQIYTINQLAVPGAAPHAVRAVITNNGTNALTGVVATLNVTGANTFTNTQTVASLAVGASATVTFAAYTPANQGTNTVTVSVPTDNNNNNNSIAETQVVNTSTFSYITPPGANTAGGVGYASGSEVGFGAKFTLSTARSVTAVRAFITDFPTSGTTQKTTVGETLYGVVVDATTGAILARSPNFVVTAAAANTLHTFNLTAPATVPAGDFIVGMVQVSPASNGTATFFPMGVQNEIPTRSGTFYQLSVSGAAPRDITATAGRDEKYMLEAVTAAPANNDLAVNEIQGYGSVAVPVGNPFGLRAVVRNAGIAGITTPVTVTLTISGANTYSATQTLTSLGVGATAVVSFANISLTNAGANTVTVTLPSDDVTGNNTISQAMTTSATRFSYIVGTAPAVNALGVPPLLTAARTVAFCGKFTVNAPRDVTAVRAFIYNDPNLLPTTANGQRSTTVYGVVVNAATGAVLARSADYVLTAADLGTLKTFNLNTSVPAGDFLVGMAQVTPVGAATAGVFPMGVQDETPARTGLFYTVNVTGAASAPVDVATNDVRFMLEAETAPPATCPVPTAFTLASATATTASFSFTAATGATGYQIVYGAQGFTPGGTGSTTSPTFTGTTYTLTGLSGGTTYDFYIRTICSATDQSAYAGPVRATTGCTPPVIAAFPYAQNFDVITAGQSLPCGITVADSNNDGFTWRATGTVDPSLATGSVARSAPNAMVYSYNSNDITVGANDWFFSPALTLTATQTYRVTFFYRSSANSSFNTTEGLEIKYGATATPAGQTRTIYTNTAINNGIYRSANSGTTPMVADIVAPAGNYYVGFHAISTGNQGFLAVDDLTISAGPLATSEALKRAVTVFPNPSNTGSFNLEIHGANAKQALAVEVTNMLGQRVYTGTAKDNFRTTVDLSNLSSGIYSIKVRNGEEYTMQQISIVK